MRKAADTAACSASAPASSAWPPACTSSAKPRLCRWPSRNVEKMVCSDPGPGKPTASVVKWRCRRGLTAKLPAVGFMAATYWQPRIVLGVSLARSYQWP